MNILFATSEAHPLIKTGGLADVSGSLPRALRNLHHDVRLVLPAYPAAVEKTRQLRTVNSITLPGTGQAVSVLEGRLPGSKVKVYLVDSPAHFNRDGGPYAGPDGQDWEDNAQRFALFARAVTAIALNQAALDWQPELVHCNDWQTGLVPALLSLSPQRPKTVFTIHNLAYQGLFPPDTLNTLALPAHWWSHHYLEFHGQLSFIKGGLVFADYITTVSPTYAEEIRTPAFGCGLDGLLNFRSGHLSGILNGVDYDVWSPGRDRLLPQKYNRAQLKGKIVNKAALQRQFGLPARADVPLLGHVGRLVDQKGIDLLLGCLTALAQRKLQLVILGTGQAELEQALREAQGRFPDRIGLIIGYDEALAHLLEAGADAFLMPSRFEPCGLNQIYSLRYGTPPIVRRTGGLADTVVDADPAALAERQATGFVFEEASAAALLEAIDRALALYADAAAWRRLMDSGMRQDYSWHLSASRYVALYETATEAN